MDSSPVNPETLETRVPVFTTPVANASAVEEKERELTSVRPHKNPHKRLFTLSFSLSLIVLCYFSQTATSFQTRVCFRVTLLPLGERHVNVPWMFPHKRALFAWQIAPFAALFQRSEVTASQLLLTE